MASVGPASTDCRASGYQREAAAPTFPALQNTRPDTSGSVFFWRQLRAELAVRIHRGVDVEVPLAAPQIRGLFIGQCCLARDLSTPLGGGCRLGFCGCCRFSRGWFFSGRLLCGLFCRFLHGLCCRRLLPVRWPELRSGLQARQPERPVQLWYRLRAGPGRPVRQPRPGRPDRGSGLRSPRRRGPG